MDTRRVKFADDWLDSPFSAACLESSLQDLPDFERDCYQIKEDCDTCDNPSDIFTVGNTKHWYSFSKSQNQTFRSALTTVLSGYRTVPDKCFSRRLSVRASLRWFFVQNFSTRLPCMLIDFILKIIICLLYVIRVGLDDISTYECDGSRCPLGGNVSRSATGSSASINWYVLLWVQRSTAVWVTEALLSCISLVKLILMVWAATKDSDLLSLIFAICNCRELFSVLNVHTCPPSLSSLCEKGRHSIHNHRIKGCFSQGHRMSLICTSGFLIETICSMPMLATIVCPIKLKDVFVPAFLNCWLAKQALQNIYNDLHLTRQRFQTMSATLLQQMVLLLVNIVCLAFINICCMQHLQRASPSNKLTMFQATYFVIVTFSTVGYGDISPDIWPSRLFVILMICVAFAAIPRQIEGIVSTYIERQRAGGEYSWRAAQRNRHIVVCSSTLTQDTLLDFLNEFYAHRKLEQYTVILLCSQELDGSKQVILKDPKWAHRVIYMKGSPLKDLDLQRCRVQLAKACFFLAPRPTQDRVKEDYRTILRSWAVKDFAPNCKQYIHLFCASNRIHVNFAEHIVCEDEFTFALLANNCLYPGLSTLVSLLVHTSIIQKGTVGPEPWQQIYGHHSRNEVYHIQLQNSVFFRQYEGETFPAASVDAHHRFGVALLAVLDSESESPHLQLNPGPEYRLKAEDFCFYMSIAREEYAKICPELLNSLPQHNNNNLDLAKQKDIEISLTVPQEDLDAGVFHTVTSLVDNYTACMTHSFTNDTCNCDSKVIDDEKKEETIMNSCTNSDSVYHSDSDSLLKLLVNRDDARNGDDDSDEWADSTHSIREDNYATGCRSVVLWENDEKTITIMCHADKNRRSWFSISYDHQSHGSNQCSCLDYAMQTDHSGNQEKLVHRCEVDHVFPVYNDMGQEKTVVHDIWLRSILLVCKHRLTTGDPTATIGSVIGNSTATIGSVTGDPPATIGSVSRQTNCHVVSGAGQRCCLVWGIKCDHCKHVNINTRDGRPKYQLIILATQQATTGIFNFIIPLRSSYIGVNGLSPIVLLLEKQPDAVFLDEIAQFPLVYYMIGCIRNVDDLLRAGINNASHLVVVNRDSGSDYGGEDILADSETIMAVQTIFKLFPNINIITELSQATNMRFMQFSAQVAFSHGASRQKQKLQDVMTSKLSHIFRLPFAAGQVFSASMLDTLLYQTFVKGYLISFLRLLLGIDAEEGSGHLSSIQMQQATIKQFSEYGKLYESLCATNGEIPFAVYRTEKAKKFKTICDKRKTFIGGDLLDVPQFINTDSAHKSRTLHPGNLQTLPQSHPVTSQHCFSSLGNEDQGDLGCLINSRLKSLELNQAECSTVRKQANTISYVITNPSPNLKLKSGDIVYTIQPSSNGQACFCPSPFPYKHGS